MFKVRLTSSLIAIVFFVVFQPFGLEHFGSQKWILIVGLCLLMTFVPVLSEMIVVKVFRMPNNLAKSSVYLIRRNQTFQITNVILLTIFISIYLDKLVCNEQIDNHLSWSNTFRVFFTVACLSFIIGMYWRNYYARKESERRLKDAMYLNGILEERQRKARIEADAARRREADRAALGAATPPEEEPAVREPEEIIRLEGSTKESLTLHPSEFIYAESDANYVHIFYFKEGKPSETSLRSSISQVEETFAQCCNIIRCHRAYVVNISHVVKFVSQDHSLKLSLRGVNGQITVSKTYVQEVKDLIINPCKRY